MTALLIAPNASKGHAPAILAACINVANSPSYVGPPTLVATFIDMGTHMEGSRHYFGDAVDLRSHSFPSLKAKQAFIKAVLARLADPNYVMFLEAAGTPNEHFHAQWKPKP